MELPADFLCLSEFIAVRNRIEEASTSLSLK
jgi:hypothetical protein